MPIYRQKLSQNLLFGPCVLPAISSNGGVDAWLLLVAYSWQLVGNNSHLHPQVLAAEAMGEEGEEVDGNFLARTS